VDQLTPTHTPTETSRSRRARGGFTLIEVLLALALLGFGMLSLAAMQLHAMQFGRSGRHTSQAALYARNQMEYFQRLPFAHADVQPTSGWSTAVARQSNVESPDGTKTEQAYAMTWRIADLTAGRTRSVDVQVTWSEPGRPNRAFTMSSVIWNQGS
jgi:type IV pilus assembly protein PilV